MTRRNFQGFDYQTKKVVELSWLEDHTRLGMVRCECAIAPFRTMENKWYTYQCTLPSRFQAEGMNICTRHKKMLDSGRKIVRFPPEA